MKDTKVLVEGCVPVYQIDKIRKYMKSQGIEATSNSDVLHYALKLIVEIAKSKGFVAKGGTA
jgi:hypothetical protein